jgi:hypothetical protein
MSIAPTVNEMILACPHRAGEWYKGWKALNKHIEEHLLIKELLARLKVITIVVHINEPDGKTKLIIRGLSDPDFSPRLIEDYPVNVEILQEDFAAVALKFGGKVTFSKTSQPNRNALVFQAVFNGADEKAAQDEGEDLAANAHRRIMQEWFDDL